MKAQEKEKEEIHRLVNWCLMVALFFIMLSTIIGCKKEPETKCYQCETLERYEFIDGSSRNEGVISTSTRCEEYPNLEQEEEGTYYGKEGTKHTVRRCKSID